VATPVRGAGWGDEVKSILTRLPMVISATSAFIVAARPCAPTDYFPFAKSIFSGASHLVRRVLESDAKVVASNFRKFLSDESVIANLLGHLEVVRILNGCGGRALTKQQPSYANKYVFGYLAKSFPKKLRREILKFHHQYLFNHVSETFYEQILQSRSILWSEIIDENCYAVSVSFNSDFHSEGDISLTFDKNGIPLYEISFSIVPASLIGGPAGQGMLLVGRVQGRKGQTEAIRIGARACHDIAPPHLLLAAAQSVAGFLALGVIGGVSNEEQLAKTADDKTSECYFNYNAFWETYLVRQKGASIYTIPIPFPERPTDQVSAAHRRRAKRKRRIKKQIADAVGAAFANNFLKPQQSQ
jgi:uncharacterized protein VirK/YbjX